MVSESESAAAVTLLRAWVPERFCSVAIDAPGALVKIEGVREADVRVSGPAQALTLGSVRGGAEGADPPDPTPPPSDAGFFGPSLKVNFRPPMTSSLQGSPGPLGEAVARSRLPRRHRTRRARSRPRAPSLCALATSARD